MIFDPRLYLAQHIILTSIDEGDGHSLLTGPAGSPYAVNIAFRILRNIVIEYMGNTLAR